MRDGRPLYRILVHFVGEDAHCVSVKQYLGDDFICELGVALNSNVFPREIHCLHGAEGVAAEGYGVGGKVLDNVAVHLVDALPGLLAIFWALVFCAAFVVAVALPSCRDQTSPCPCPSGRPL